MAPGEEELKKRVGRKLTKRTRPPHRLPSSHVPDRLKYGDDVNDDVTAVPKGAGAAANLNQSIFTMIAAAGSKTDFHSRFDESSESDEGEPQGPESASRPLSRKRKTEATADRKDNKIVEEQQASEAKVKEGRYHTRKLSEHKLLRSLPKLSLKSGKGKEAESRSSSHASHEQENLSPTKTSPRLTPRDAPMMSRMLEAELGEEETPPDNFSPSAEDPQKRVRAQSSPATLLATRLMEIFGFDKPEKVVAEYPCWLLQAVLLQGYMYITRKHICFYAYLPKKDNVIAKTGYLSKRARQHLKYTRYWFTLKGDVLSYYNNPADLYFPAGHIDLRYGISASLCEPKDKTKESKDFMVNTNARTYHLRADSPTSAREWVKTLRRVIFRSHNDGDSVKISLPIENVIDIEENPVMDFAETFKIRVVESEDSFAIDEYFFSFFSFGKEAFGVLKSLVDDTAASRMSQDLLSPTSLGDSANASRDPSPGPRKSLDLMSGSARGATTPIFRESVRATLLPQSPVESGRASPRLSGDFTRSSGDLVRSSIDFPSPEYGRASFDRGRRSGSTSRLSLNRRRSDKSPLVLKQGSSDSKKQGSSDSFVHSVEQGTESSAAVHSTTDTLESASQILNRSDVFHSPTINRLRESPSASKEDLRRRSEDTARSASPKAEVKVVPPSRVSTSLETKPRQKSGQPIAKSSNNGENQLQQSNSSPSLQDLVKVGGFPLQRAAGFAGYLRNRSKRMSSLLASESMGYIEKVHGMWAGGRRHYGENEGVIPDDKMVDPEDEEASCGQGDRFRAHFALPDSEKLQATYFGYMQRVLPLYGKIYISNRKFCFRSLLPGTKTKLILPLKDIENVDKEKGFRLGYHGIVLVIRGHEEMFFEFNSAEVRDDCAVTLLQNLESMKYLVESGLLAQQDKEDAEAAKAEHEMLQEARKEDLAIHDVKPPSTVPSAAPEADDDGPPVLFDDPRASIINFKPTEALRITCLTIGSRGDVQPYIALCKGLLAEGHKPRIATHVEFEGWVRGHGIDFTPVDGDPAELMRICVENGMFTYSFLKEASGKFRSWIDSLLSSAWKACQNTDLLIESPSAMAGIHIAEALGIPYFRAFTMPWTRTRAYPHAFAVPDHKIGGAYNYFSYVMFDNVFWKAISGQVNRWRKRELGLGSTNLDKMQPNKIPFLYNFSPHVVVPPIDYSDWVRVTGYWFLDEATNWTPPKELTAFIAKARADKKRIVYIGFGSIVVSDPAALTKTVVDSVLKADVRCILSKGWSDRLGDPSAVKTEVPLPTEIHQIKSAPHDWLFKQIDAAVHHGGAGTTGASLRAGLPTIIKPFFGDQFFFGSRVEDLGVGICMRKVNVSIFARALWEAVHSERMIAKAKVLGQQIREEDGVGNAIQAIYRDLEYAKTLIKLRHKSGENTVNDDDLATIEESWTFIGDESDPELKARIKSWNPASMDQIKAERLSRDLSTSGLKAVGAVAPKLSGSVRRP